jgi:hypothetical protein
MKKVFVAFPSKKSRVEPAFWAFLAQIWLKISSWVSWLNFGFFSSSWAFFGSQLSLF